MVVMSQSMSGKLKSSPVQNVAFLCAAMSVLMVSCMYAAIGQYSNDVTYSIGLRDPAVTLGTIWQMMISFLS